MGLIQTLGDIYLVSAKLIGTRAFFEDLRVKFMVNINNVNQELPPVEEAERKLLEAWDNLQIAKEKEKFALAFLKLLMRRRRHWLIKRN